MRSLAMTLAASVALAAAAAQALEPAPLVMLPAGTKLQQNEGGTPIAWTVTESKPGAYAAARDDGSLSFQSIGGIVTPAHSFVDQNGAGRQKVTKGDPLAIYPLQVGKTTKFSVEGQNTSRGWTWHQEHSCVVTGTEKVTVKAGSFDAFVVRCERVTSGRGKDQTITRYYVPAISATALTITEDLRNNNKWSTELVALPNR